MKEYKLVAFDMDGTLLNSQKEISKENLEAIREALSKGKTVSIATGRSVPELKEYLEDLEIIPYFICSNGAKVFDNRNKKNLSVTTVDRTELLKVFELTKDKNIMYHIHSDLSIIQRSQNEKLKDYKIDQYQKLFDTASYFVDDIYQWYKENDVPVYKFDCYCTGVKEREELHELVKEMNFSLTYSEITSLEFSAKGITKGTGLKKLCDSLGMDISQAIAVGDSENDISMIKAAGLGVAMGNSRQVVRDSADAVTKDNDHSGCAQVIREYLI